MLQLTPTAARRIAYRVVRRSGLSPAQARDLVTGRMHPDHFPRLTPADVRFAASIAAQRELRGLEVEELSQYRGAAVAWNTGHGWSDWHLVPTPAGTTTLCGLTLPTLGRRSVRLSDRAVHPDEICLTCARALLQGVAR